LGQSGNVIESFESPITPTRTIDARRGNRFDRPTDKEVLVLSATEELTRLIALWLRQPKRARDATDFTEPVGKIPFSFRPPPATRLFAAESTELTTFLD
jgi:hypothetical protein